MPARHSSAGRWASTTARKGTETVNAINNLALITGQHRPRPARRPSRSRASATPWARAKPASPRRCRATASSSARKTAKNWRAIWHVPVDRIPAARGLAYPDIIEAALDRRIRALWVIATNPIVSFPNLGVLRAVARDARVPRRPGRIPSDADVRARRPRAAGGDLGRERGRLHELRAACQQGEPRSGSAGRGARDFDIFLDRGGRARMP